MTSKQLARNLTSLFPCMPEERGPIAAEIYRAVFEGLPLGAWSKQGSVITRFVNGKKINFAARKTHCTIGFRGRAAVEFYRFLGGDCPAGEVTIKIPYERDWNPAPVVQTVGWYLNPTSEEPPPTGRES